MTKVVALQTWSNGTITMDEKSVLDIEDALASDLIAKGICADAATYFGGGSSGGGVLVVTYTDGSLDKTWQEIHDAMLSGGAVIEIPDDGVYSLESVYIDSGYFVMSSGSTWKSNTASGYPTRI